MSRVVHAAALLSSALLSVLLLGACGGDGALECNGSAALCDRPLDEISFPMTHNSHAAEELGYNPAATNQVHAVPRQLADGVRALNFDVYDADDMSELWVCHGYCTLGHQSFVEALTDVTTFLDEHPHEVLLLQFETYVTAAQTVAAFDAAGLTRYVHTQAKGAAWPTLREMIAANRRLVVLADAGGGDPAWYHVTDDYVYATNWGAATTADLSCDTPPPFAHGLFLLNHTLTNPIATPELADMINHDPYFLDRAQQCAAAAGKNPNLVAVDYYSIGDLFAVVAALNAP